MKILSIDTSSNICGVSILEDTKLICKLDENTGRTHSENLMPMIQKAFNKTNLLLKDMDLIVCDKGPGSFTGIRIGIATAKAFNDSMQIPCIGISSLEALSYNIQQDGLICSILDCKNENCYFGLYERKNNEIIELLKPQSETIDSFLSILNTYCLDNFDIFTITFVGDGIAPYKEKIQNTFANAIFTENNELDSYNLGLAGFNNFTSNDTLEDLLPLYLKKPQAQRQLEEHLNKN